MGKTHEKGDFFGSEGLGKFAKIGETRCSDTFQIPPIRGKIEIKFKDLFFAVMGFQRKGPEGLPKLLPEGAGSRMQKAHQLLCQCGSAGNHVPGLKVLPGCPGDGQEVDPGMEKESLILKSKCGFDQERIHLIEGNIITPKSLVGGIKPHELSVMEMHGRAEIPRDGRRRDHERQKTDGQAETDHAGEEEDPASEFH